MLFWAKVGQYTEEEFETAFGQFKATNKPFILIYFKDAEVSTGSANKRDLMSLWAFQEKLGVLGHFYTVYKNIDELKFHFDQQLEKLAASTFAGAQTIATQGGAVIKGAVRCATAISSAGIWSASSPMLPRRAKTPRR